MSPSPEKVLFELALARPQEKRAAFLDAMCEGDAALRAQLEALLAAHEQPATVFATKAGSPPPGPEPQWTDAPDEAVGQTLGRYQLMERIGEGGCGVVYVAEQTQPVRRLVALKVIKLGMDTRQVIARFEAERQALAMMDHPNIAKVLDAGTTDTGRPYFVMELVRGVRITDYCNQANLTTRQRLDLFIKVCHAIQHAHQKGIIHRDIKPSNILVTSHDGVPVPLVIDFGIAKATEGRLTDATLYTQLHQFMGTPAYMSPEQAEMSGLDIDTRSDIYSLGVLLYELLTGTTPFDPEELMASGLDAMRKTIREKQPMRPSTRLNQALQGTEAGRRKSTPGLAIPTAEELSADSRRRLRLKEQIVRVKGDLDWIVMKCLEKDRQRRYDTANGLAADLKRHLDNEPVTARPPSRRYRFEKLVRRNKTAAVGIAGVALALVLGLGLATAAWARERQARQRELKQSVRVRTVETFIQRLLWEVVPALFQQGNVRGARELVNQVDALASSALSNAPMAEIKVREALSSTLGGLFNDFAAAMKQKEAANRLAPRVTDELRKKLSDQELSLGRDMNQIMVLGYRLWVPGGQETAMTELESMYAEFMRRTPPNRQHAFFCRFFQGNWLRHAGELEEAEKKLADAYALIPKDPAPLAFFHQVSSGYAQVLADRGKHAQAEQVAREGMDILAKRGRPEWSEYLVEVEQLSNALCGQGRFAEAIAMLEAQRTLLSDVARPESHLLRVDALHGEVLARSGKAREALPFLEAVATHRLSKVEDWSHAFTVATAAGDHRARQQLLGIGLLRFASTAEGGTAYWVASGLLDQGDDETTRIVARGLVGRVAKASDWSREFSDSLGAALAHREHRPAEALDLLDKSHGTRGTETISRLILSLPATQAGGAFLRAMLGAELGRTDEARRDYARGRQLLKRAFGDTPGHDRGKSWFLVYAAENSQREAEALFRARGIPLPDPDQTDKR